MNRISTAIAAVIMTATAAEAKPIALVSVDGGKPRKVHIGSIVGIKDTPDANGICPPHQWAVTPLDSAEDEYGVSSIALQKQPDCRMKVVPASSAPHDMTVHDPSGFQDSTMPAGQAVGQHQTLPDPTPSPTSLLDRLLSPFQPREASASTSWRWFYRQLTISGYDWLGVLLTQTGSDVWGLWTDTHIWTAPENGYIYLWSYANPSDYGVYWPPWATNWWYWTWADNSSLTQIYVNVGGDFASCWTPVGPRTAPCYWHEHHYNQYFYGYPGISGLPLGQCAWWGEPPWVHCAGERIHF
jgi:hypothetical protein